MWVEYHRVETRFNKKFSPRIKLNTKKLKKAHNISKIPVFSEFPDVQSDLT